jgi:hypothetical protein
LRNLECGYEYQIILGYDAGDLFYDSEEGQNVMKGWRQVSRSIPLRMVVRVLTLAQFLHTDFTTIPLIGNLPVSIHPSRHSD